MTSTSSGLARLPGWCWPVLLLCVLLSACGGSGGGGGNSSGSGSEAPAATHSLSGSISIPAGSVMDSDNSDTAHRLSNNSFGEAQPIPNPAFVAGYVSLSSGIARITETQTYRYTTDTVDLYLVTLIQGQVVRLYHQDSLGDGLGFYTPAALALFDLDGVQVGSEQTGDSRIKTLTAPAAGSYYVRVRAQGSKTLYQLVVGLSESSSAQRQAEFVPGEVIVEFEDASLAAQDAQNSGAQASSRRARAALTLSNLRAAGMAPVRQHHERHLLMDVSALSLPDAEPATKAWRARQEQAQQQSDPQEAHARLRTRTQLAVDWLRTQPGVERVHLNYIRHAMHVPNDPLYARQWHLPLIALENAWDDVRSLAMTPTNVAVLDTGIRGGHEDLQGALLAGYDFIGKDTDPTDPGEGAGSSLIFHGTHVAGVIGALSDNSKGGASVGGVPDKNAQRWLKVIPLRVLGNDGSGNDFDIAAAIRLAASGTTLNPDTGASISLPHTARVINLSLGSDGACGELESAIAFARARGVSVVAAAGNENSSVKQFPAACPGVIAVSSVGQDKTRAPYSNFAATLADNWIDVAAPGGNMVQDIDTDGFADGILSAGREPANYVRLQGTSMAAPHVAGVLGLMLGVNPNLTPSQIDTLLAQGQLTTDIGATGTDRFFGQGLINAFKAVRAAASREISALLVASTKSLSFDADDVQKDLVLSNGGTGDLALAQVTASEPWLSVVATAVDANALGTYRVRVDRTGLAVGLYAATITATPVVGEPLTVQVALQVVSASALDNAGRHYVLLVTKTADGDYETRYELPVLPANGRYEWQISEVTAGEYYLVAGTDLDNDGFICLDGEFCAEYPVVGDERPIKVDRDLAGLNMATVYMFAQTLDQQARTAAVAGQSTPEKRPVPRWKRRE